MSAAPRSKVSVHVLVVVDELILQSEIERRLSQDGHRAATVGSVREAIERLRREPFDTVLCDLHASPGDGAELLQWLGSYYPSIPVVVITAAISPEARARSDGGSVRIIEKPVDLERLVKIIAEIGPRRGFFSNAIEIEFFDYVQMIAITGRDKAVMVTTREGVGSIWFEHGDISHVQFKEWRGEQGFYKLLAVGQGTFRETLFRAPPARTVMRSSTHLLMEAARLMDEGLLGADDVPPPPPLEPEPDDEEASRQLGGEVSEADDWSDAAPEPSGVTDAAGIADAAMSALDDIALPTDDDEATLAPVKATPVPTTRPRPASAATPLRKPEAPGDGVPVVRRKVQTLERVVSKPQTQPVLLAQPATPPVRPTPSRAPTAATAAATEAPPARAPKKAASDLFDDPETREALLGQFWQYEGVDGVAIISSTGKVMAEDMRNNSTAVTLAGFYMRGAARIARMLGYNVFDGVIARSTNNQQLIMIGMGATSAVLSVAQTNDPDAIRDQIMGLEGER